MKQTIKKLTSLFMAVCMILTAVIVAMPITASAATSVSSWDQITSATGDYILTSNITVPAGGTFSGTFSGTIDGNGHTITVADTMFSTVSGATFKNFTINGDVTVSPFIDTASGSTVTIENVVSNVKSSSAENNAAFISNASGATTIKLTNCVNNGAISSAKQVGAFIGWSGTAFTAVLTGCVNNGTITSTGSHAGGFMGCLENTAAKFDVTFNACSNKGAVIGNNTSKSEASGFVAFTSGTSATKLTFNNCYSSGNLTSKSTDTTSGKYSASGFVSRVKLGAVAINNSLSNIATLTAGSGFTAHFWYASEGATLTATNSYYIKNSVALSSNESGKGFTAVTAAQLASGEIAYKLNGSTQVNPTWYQLIGTDAVPHHTVNKDAIVRYDSAAAKYTNDYVYVVEPKFDITLDANYGTYSVYNFSSGANESFTGIKVDVYVTNINSSLTYGIAGIDGFLNFDGAALTPYYTTAEELNGTKGIVNPGPIANFPTYTRTVSGVSLKLFSVEGLCTDYVAGSGSLRMNYIIDVDNHAAWASSKTGIKTADAVKLSYYFSINGTVTNGATYTFEVPANPDATETADATLRAPYYTGASDQTAFGTVFGRGAKTTCTTTTSSSYTVTFVDYDNTVLKTQTVAAGGSATPPAAPTREGYDFVNWNGAYTSVYANTTVTAVYAIKTYTVTFWADGQAICTDTVEHGGTAVCSTTPAKEGYTFTGWNASLTNITADTDIIAKFTINTYTVTFKDYDGTVLSTQTVNHGANATAPANPTREGYTFTGWSGKYMGVTGNSTVTATYTQNAAPAEFFTFASGADTTYISIDETNGYLVFKAGANTAAEIIALFADTNVSITKADGTTAVTGTAKVGTTYIITSTINGVSESLTVVVVGDLNGDGSISAARDFSALRSHLSGTTVITNAALLVAADVNCDGSISAARDISKLRNYLNKSVTNF